MRRRALVSLALLLGVHACAGSTSSESPALSDSEREIEDNYGNRYFRGLFGKDAEEVASGPLDPKAEQELLVRGEYLALGPAACGSCHGSGARPGSPLSGGRLLQDRFGAVRAANITSSKSTGIGTWTRNDISRAIRSALAKDEVPLSLDLHATYRWLSDSDAQAIAVYLLNTTPVESEVERRVLGTFEKNRAGIFSRYRKVEGFIPAPPKSKSAAYGRYLAYHVAGCYGCHTPEAGFVDDAVPFSGVAARDKSLVGSFKALFSLLVPKSAEEKSKENESSMKLLSPDAQTRLGTEGAPGEETVKSASPGLAQYGASIKYDEAIDNGAIPVSGPDIRSSGESGLVGWSKDDVVSYLSSGKTPEGELKDGRVCPWPFFRAMDDSDKEAIAVFIKRQ